jgi:hypothetical protein
VTLPAYVAAHHRHTHIVNICNCGNTYVGLLTEIVPLPDLGVSLSWVSNDRQPIFMFC